VGGRESNRGRGWDGEDIMELGVGGARKSEDF
jgi:hypothetical protein